MLTMAEALSYASARPDRLAEWHPVNPGPEHRVLLLCTEVEDAIRDREFWTRLPRERENGPFDRRFRLMMLLDRWVGGAQMAVDREIKGLSPRSDGVWELRSTYSVGVRVIGMMAAFNVFVGFDVHRRDLLGAGGSVEWNKACARAISGWREVFGDARPLYCPEVLTPESARKLWDDHGR